MWTDTFANPFPNRNDLMSLSTITKIDAPARKKFINQSKSLSTKDIEGAKPQLSGYQFNNKISTINFTQDIEHAQPKMPKFFQNKPIFVNQNRDIESTNRTPHNPLEPCYKLPSFETRPFTPPKFIRDNIAYDDVEGSKPAASFKWNMRNSMNIEDIEGAKPKPQTVLKKPNLMDARDISATEWKTRRQTNPLDPEYQVQNEQGQSYKIGLVEGSKPRCGYGINEKIYRPLTTDDIDGAKPGTTNAYLKKIKQVRNQIEAQDILGAQVGTLKKVFNTSRSTNPLNPEYQYLGQSQEKIQAKKPVLEVQKQVDPQLEKSKAAFFAATPPAEIRKASFKSQTLENQNQKPQSTGFQESAARFFCSSRGKTAVDDQLQLERNKNRFYATPEINKKADTFRSAKNPASIFAKPGVLPQSVKKDYNLIKSQQEFYADQITSPKLKTEQNYASTSQSQNREFQLSQSKFLNQGPNTPETQKLQMQQDTASFYENPSTLKDNSYKFALQRQNIGKPAKSAASSSSELSRNKYKFFGE